MEYVPSDRFILSGELTGCPQSFVFCHTHGKTKPISRIRRARPRFPVLGANVPFTLFIDWHKSIGYAYSSVPRLHNMVVATSLCYLL